VHNKTHEIVVIKVRNVTLLCVPDSVLSVSTGKLASLPVLADLVIAPHYRNAFRGRRAANYLLQCDSLWDGQEFADALLDYVSSLFGQKEQVHLSLCMEKKTAVTFICSQ